MDDAELRRQIVGTWKLVSVHYEDQATKERTPVYGDIPRASRSPRRRAAGSL